MNYLEAFLKEKTPAEKHHIPPDETAKTASVSFGSEPLARSSASFSPSSSSQKAEATGSDLVDELREHAPNSLDDREDPRTTPAASIVETCRCHGIALRLDESGRLVVGNADGSGTEPALWSTLLVAIEAHLPAITALVAAGFNLYADLVAHEAA
jgi:hypothetical protein